MKKQQSNISVMLRMIGLVKPLSGWMFLAVCLGVLGFLCAIFIPYLAAVAFGHFAIHIQAFPYTIMFVMMAVLAVLRGVLHYGEQACNHYIAFTLLALIRDRVFRALRRLCPAKLDGKDSGNLITLITTDIELLEVFYAHTISPILIAILTCAILLVQFAQMHVALMAVALCAYILCGIFLPMFISKKGKEDGQATREQLGALSNDTLESLRGMREILQYQQGEARLQRLKEKSHRVNEQQHRLKKLEGNSSALSNLVVSGSSLVMLIVGVSLFQKGEIDQVTVLLSTVLLLSSFGPVLALSALSNHLLTTLASARRVLALLDEDALVEDIEGRQATKFDELHVEEVTFAYEEEAILKEFTASFKKGTIHGILGRSGSGKSTLLKLMMRFYESEQGQIRIGAHAIRDVNTKELRAMQSFVAQDTQLFHDSIEQNIRIANLNATHEQLVEACKKANLHEFIMSLPHGYETMVSELGDSLSGGEKQRLSLARAFLHDAPCILLDEPTSNLDALNEGLILRTLKQQKDKTILLVSHRESTMRIADQMLSVEHGRIS